MLLEVADLAVDLATPDGLRRVVERTSFSLAEGESLGVVGESGSGKTMTALALMALTPEGARVSGSVRFEERELVGLEEKAMRRLRGDRIAMIFQEPMTALNPLHSVGAQVAEPLMLHRGLGKRDARERAVDLLERVRLADPERAARAYPFELSGGERQRAMIAMAIGCGPRLIIADEPTTALDVTVQARILALIDTLRSESKMAVMLVSHDLAVIAGHCDRVIVMYAGMIMESGPVEAVLREPRNPYTLALLEARPRPGAPRGARLKTIPGAPPTQHDRRTGCPFAGRCALTVERCWTSRRPKWPSARAIFRAVIARAKCGIRADERSAAARGLFARQDLSPAWRGPVGAQELASGLGRRQLLDGAGPFVRDRGRSRARANRHWRGSRWRSTGRMRAKCAFMDARCSTCRDANCGRRARICRWCSRTRTVRSIRACAWTKSSPSRSRPWAA